MCKTLINRAKTICEVSNIDNELEHLRNVLKLNGTLSSVIHSEYQSSVFLPHVVPASHKIERILKEVGVQVYHSSQKQIV